MPCLGCNDHPRRGDLVAELRRCRAELFTAKAKVRALNRLIDDVTDIVGDCERFDATDWLAAVEAVRR